MRLHDPRTRLREATFVSRDNRFRITVELGGRLVGAHLPNSGRLRELLSPGRRLWLRPATTGGRKTAYDVLLVDLNGVLVAVDARLPNRLVEEALRAGLLPSLAGYPHIRHEVNHGESRLDFVLEGKGPRCLVEVKSVTLVRDGLALFPDAPTERGRRHVEELRQAVLAGERAAVIFVIQREDVRAFAPNDEADSLFGDALRQAADAGVEIYAHACLISWNEMRLGNSLPVMLS